ncbi:MAG: trigger factor [Crocinitomicaceae bacterium]
MNVIREDKDVLNALLKVKISPEDYEKKVADTLNKFRKTAKIPGFRPGHAPIAMIQKQYGKAFLAEELNKLANDALYKFIIENKLDILGNPIPKENSDVVGNFDQPTDFEFSFEIGFSPVLDLPLNEKSKFDYYTVKVDKELIDKQVEDLQRRYGKLTSAETVEERDMVLGKFEELNEDGSIKEGGVSNSTTISLEFLSDKKSIKQLVGKNVNECFELDPNSVSKDDKDKATMLGVSEDELKSVGNKFQFTITDIKRMELAALDEFLFEKLYMDGEVKTEEDLRKRVQDDLENMFSKDSERILTRDVYQYLVNETKTEFPESFLKRWIKVSSEKPVSDEDLDKEFDAYLKSLKWQLIQTKIFKDNNIQLNNEEVITYTKSLLAGNYAQYGIPAPEDAELTETATRLLKNKEQANGIYDRLAEQKLTEFFKSTVKLNSKAVSYDEFVEIASKN